MNQGVSFSGHTNWGAAILEHSTTFPHPLLSFDVFFVYSSICPLTQCGACFIWKRLQGDICSVSHVYKELKRSLAVPQADWGLWDNGTEKQILVIIWEVFSSPGSCWRRRSAVYPCYFPLTVSDPRPEKRSHKEALLLGGRWLEVGSLPHPPWSLGVYLSHYRSCYENRRKHQLGFCAPT